MVVTTGYGYYTDSNGHILHKYVLPLGEHPDPSGMTVVEVANQTALDAVVIYVAPVSPIDAFNVDQFCSDLLTTFASDSNVLPYYAIVKDMASFKNFTGMKAMVTGLVSSGKLTSDEETGLIGDLANQGIVWANL